MTFLALAERGRSQTFGIVHRFVASSSSQSPLIQGADGSLYGTTSGGGESGAGTAFRIDTHWQFQSLHAFGFADGASPSAALLQASDGYFYGTAAAGGASNLGTVFRMDVVGNVVRLHSFTGADGSHPSTALIQGDDGAFYGTTSAGGAGGQGTVFRMDASGALVTLHDFAGADGSSPSTLLQASDHLFYGTTSDGGASDLGTVFRVDASGQFVTLHSFDGIDGATPHDALIQATDGEFYGITMDGSASQGTAFRMDSSGSVTTIFLFGTAHPYPSLVQGTDGAFYGITAGYVDLILGVVYGTAFRLDGSGSYATLHTFADLAGYPQAALIQASDGQFYGTQGGLSPALANGNANGTVFQLTPAGGFVIVHPFQATEPSDPHSAFIQGSDGVFYGTTIAGGDHFAGVTYRIDALGHFTTLHHFQGVDGSRPYAALIQGADGSFYGSTDGGNPQTVWGRLFRMDALGTVSALHVFQGVPDGGEPQTEMIQASDGNLYGTTTRGGASDLGLAFRADPGSGALTPLASFGFGGLLRPSGSLLQASDGKLYGMTNDGGDNFLGAIFRMDLDGGNLTIVYSFNGTDGAKPYGSLIQAPDGNFYGTASQGGENWSAGDTFGTVFKMDPSGTVTRLHSFNGLDGYTPVASLVDGLDGYFYGVTSTGGPDYGGGSVGYGVLFRIDAAGNFEQLHNFVPSDGRPQSALVRSASGTLYGALSAGYSGRGGLLYSVGSFPVALNAIVPRSGPASGGASLDLLGAGFQDGAGVSVGGAAGPESFVVDSTFLYGTTPALTPGALNDVTVTNPDSTSQTLPGAYFADFLDVPQSDIFHDSVEAIFRAGVTAGCGEGNYCRDAAALRRQMAVFVLKAKEGSSYVPPPAIGIFTDVPASDPFAPWIEELYHRGVVAGCGDGTTYCPDDPVLRQQMAVFLLKTLLGADYVPPACFGIFPDVPCANPFAAWIEDLYARGIAAGCGAGDFCPASPTTRGQMSAFLSRTFGLF